MHSALPRVFTIAPDQPFLEVLADAVLAGFPLADAMPPSGLALARWKILLPTRRAVRELERIFFERSGGRGLLLPDIRPIGDIDEALLPAEPEAAHHSLPEAITPTGQLLLLIDLIDDWARDNPQTRLAREVADAPHQAYALALSLQEFLDSLETEEADATRIPELYGLESARHREAILEFLAIARQRYPARLEAVRRISPAARRSLVLRHEARRLGEARPLAPVIAAGSTGSIPATRDLLRAIALLPNGAVVLPGLDTAMDEASWTAVGPPHPQHALKQLLAFLALPRTAVPDLAQGSAGPRGWLASEIMRPADTSDRWHDAIASHGATIAEALSSVELIETAHLQEEAAVIALLLRDSLETPGKTASLVTPDRALARRVKAELLRWDIAIDDSGGEPLLRFGGAALIHVLTEAVSAGFSAESLASLLRHDMCLLGRSPAEARRHVALIELAALRGAAAYNGLADLPALLRRAAPGPDRDPHLHLALQRLPDTAWDEAIAFATDLAATLCPLAEAGGASFAQHLAALTQACEALAGDRLWADDVGEVLREVLATAQLEAHHLRFCDFERAAAIIRHVLRAAALRPRNPQASRLSILGLLEARLMRPDLVVLGGLTEGIWPGLPDAGPWLNRPMRDTLNMQQPERAIGQTAHDFVQSFGAREVKLVRPRRVEDAPAVPSRWILRLQMILKAAGLNPRNGSQSPWPRLARALNEPQCVEPRPKPRPKPPVAARPRRLSVTRIETLIRDPYAIYARHILGLEPVDPIAAAPDPSRRGTIIHSAIGDFLGANPLALPAHALEELLAAGRQHFAVLQDDPAAMSFWWPRFARIARWLIDEELRQRPGLRAVHAETSGRLDIPISDGNFTLTCRADRIDVLADGSARIIDYKTGAVPSAKQVQSGLAPQLTLQAAILQAGGFDGLGAVPVSDLTYIKLGGGDPAGEIRTLKLDPDAATLATAQLAGLATLLAGYANPAQPYLPRTLIEREDDAGAYDHLSRYREWALAGEAR